MKRSYLIHYLFSCILMLCVAGSLQAQVATSYTYSSPGDVKMVFTTGGTVLGAPGQTTAVYSNVPIGFSFTFNGKTYSQVGVSNSGFIWFGNTGPAASVTSPISDNTGEDGVISAYGSSIQGNTSSSLTYLTEGIAPNRTFTVQWEGYAGEGDVDGNTINRFDLQIVLNECSNVIDVILTGDGYLWNSGFDIYGEVGLRGTSNTDYLNRATDCNTYTWETSEAGTSDAATCTMGSDDGGFGCWPGDNIFSKGGGLTSGTEYIYTPLGSTPCSGGNSIATGSIAGPFCPCAPVNVIFTSTGTFAAGNTYIVELSDKNGSFASADTIGSAGNDTLHRDTIPCTIPCNALAGTHYRIRVVSDSPSVAGSDNGSDITIDSIAEATVTITSNKGAEVCQGTAVTFTASSTFGGSGPSFQWFVNGVSMAVNGSGVFTDDTLHNGDSVVCQMLTSYPCALSGIVNSNTINMIVDPSVTPSVSITASANNICQDIAVMFTAYPVNGGTLPLYQWTVNGFNVGTNSPEYSSSTLNNGDKVSVVLTSNASCISTPTAFGNIITMVLAPLPAVPVALPGSGATGVSVTANWNVVPGAIGYFLDVSTSVSFSTFVTGYNNLNVGNVTTYTVTGLNDATDYYYRVRAANTCGSGPNSNSIKIATILPGGCTGLTGGNATPAISDVCSGLPQLLTLSGATAGSAQWQVSPDNVNWSNISGATNSSYTTPALTTKEYYRCLTAVPSCYTVSSTTAEVDISTTPVVKITNVTATSATVSWTPYSPGFDNISWSGAGSGSIAGVTSNPYILTGLTPNSPLVVTVTPLISCSGIIATTATAQTLCGAPAIVSVAASASPASGFKVVWNSVTGVSSYRVYYYALSGTASNWSFVDTTDTMKTVSSLLPGTVYAVYIATKNCPATGSIGDGSTIDYVTTNPAPACGPPPVVSAYSGCPDGVTINITGTAPYYITLRRISPSISTDITYASYSSVVNVSLGNFGTGSVWEVFARSRCVNGMLSAASNIVDVVVQPACPVVTNVVLSNVTCNGFIATWNPDSCNNVPVNYYELLVKKLGALNFSGYNTGTSDYYQVNWLAPFTTYQVAVLGVACNGSVTAISNIATASLPICREEVADVASNNGISVGNDKESVLIYPNPSAGQLLVDIGSNLVSDASVKIEIVNTLGQYMLTNIAEMHSGHLLTSITVPAGAASGIYFVRVTVGENTYTNRVMISK